MLLVFLDINNSSLVRDVIVTLNRNDNVTIMKYLESNYCPLSKKLFLAAGMQPTFYPTTCYHIRTFSISIVRSVTLSTVY